MQLCNKLSSHRRRALTLSHQQVCYAAAHSCQCTKRSTFTTSHLHRCETALYAAAAVQAVWVSDCVLGDRSPETRAAFISQLQQVSTEAAPEDVQWLVSRPAGNAEASSGPQLFKGQPMPVSPPTAVLDARRASRVTTESSSQFTPQDALVLAHPPVACVPDRSSMAPDYRCSVLHVATCAGPLLKGNAAKIHCL